MASKEYLEKLAELKTACKAAANAVSQAKQILRATEDLWYGIVNELVDDVNALSCDKCYQDGTLMWIEGETEHHDFCDCQHGIEARQESEEAEAMWVAESREVQK